MYEPGNYVSDLPGFSKGHGAESEKGQIRARENILRAEWGATYHTRYMKSVTDKNKRYFPVQ